MAEIHKQRAGVDPLLEANFRIEVEGLPDIGFKTFSDVTVSDATAKYREGTHPNWHRKQRGLKTYDPITLERGVIEDSTTLQQWYDTGERKTVDIIRCNHLGEPSTAIYRLYEAYPSKLVMGKGDADAEDAVAIMQLEITFEWFDPLAQ